MAVFGIAITKEIDWRGGVQPISNVYHYSSLPGVTFNDDDVVNALVSAEKAIYASSVRFVKARTWGPTDGPAADSVTRLIKDLTGQGALTATVNMYREAAVLITWPLGRYGSKNRPQFLRKWHHTCYNHGLPAEGTPAGGATPAAITTYINTVAGIAAGTLTNYVLSTAEGKRPTGDGKLYPYLDHRQFGDQWRRT